MNRARNFLAFWALPFAAVGLLALAYWAFEFVSARVYQAQETRRFASERHAEPRPADTAADIAMDAAKSSTPAERPYPSSGSVVAMLAIPRLGLSTVVVEGTEARELKLGPGHIPGTSLPGEGRNVGIAGHRDTFFRPLRLIRINDTIQVITRDQEYRYTVVSTKIVGPEDVQVLYPAGHETLTLVTCYPFDFVGAAPKRFIVRADCANCPAERE
jgi:sortase A